MTSTIIIENKISSIELTEAMVKMTGFRNVIAYDYEKMDYAIAYNALQNNLADIQEFTDVIEKI